MILGSRAWMRIKIAAWVVGAFAVLVTLIADDVDPDPAGTPPALQASESAK